MKKKKKNLFMMKRKIKKLIQMKKMKNKKRNSKHTEELCTL